MSKGNPIVSGRITHEEYTALVDQLRMTSAHANCRTVLEDAIGSFVSIAVREKLAKMKRGREWAKRKAATVSRVAAPCVEVDSQCTPDQTVHQAQ